ncbi:hypothetical protein POVWA1_069630 [Plasmodium ovale wallikeri]|uniref:STP1 protein n=1 Tax=Plasmodium ovale wallikeri TaxID=864142 RepID=A0A1A9AGQ6_PLAOA|nr:hypothetical protein POVWA1_069630 [Plasmodium ovale wallikeri]
MSDNLGYTTDTHNIPVEVFLGMIEGDIKKLIRKYGHKNCGLMHEDLCKEIHKIVNKNKEIIFRHVDQNGKTKLNTEWRSQRNGFFKKLFDEEGFINMCYPFKNIEHQDIYQLLSRHVNFCKEKDKRRSDLGENPEYSECVEYNSWIDNERTTFTLEYLRYVRKHQRPTVNGYFSTKEYPRGHDPRSTYHNSKMNCNLYKSPSTKHKQKTVAKASPDSPHPPATPDARKESQEKDGRPMPDKGGRIEITKSDVQILPQTKPPFSDDETSSLIHTKGDDTANRQHDDFKTKDTVSSNNAQDTTGKPTEATDTQTKTPEQLPEPTISISPKDSTSAKVLDPPPSVNKDQGAVSDSTPGTTSTTSDATHYNRNISSPSAPDLSLVQSGPTAVAVAVPVPVPAVTSQYSKEPTSDPVSKSIDQDAYLISALSPGLAPSQASVSNSSASETSSTTTSTTTSSTMTLTPDSPLAQNPHLPTSSAQPVVTTSVDTTITQTTISASSSPTITDSVMGTHPISSIVEITSTKGGSGEPDSLPKTIAGSQDLNTASPKKQDGALPPNTGNTSQTNTMYDQK